MPGVRPALRSAFHRRWIFVKGELARRVGASERAEVVRTYEMMRADNAQAPAIYHPGEFWARINRRYADLIWAGALDNLRNEYFNRTFAGPEPESRQVYRALLFVYRQALRAVDTDGFLDREADPSVGGNGDQEIVGGRPVSLDFLQSVEEAYRIRAAWREAGKPGDPAVIVEIGAGYGRLAYVCRRMMPSCTYVILDLPEALMCSSTWLGAALGGDVVPYRESREATAFTRESLGRGRVWTLGAHQIDAIADDAVDAFVNIYSFAEMPRKSTENYFRHIDRLTRGILYSKQRKLEQNRHDGERISIDDYPIPAHWRELYKRTSSLYEDFFEAAYVTGDRRG